MSGYKVTYYYSPEDHRVPVREYINNQSPKDRAKIFKYIEFLRQNDGVLDEPFTRHIQGKIRELRVDFSKNRHRILFFTFIGKNIIVLHAFLKHTERTPEQEINKAMRNYLIVQNNPKLYE